jgi:hypothetical protein
MQWCGLATSLRMNAHSIRLAPAGHETQYKRAVRRFHDEARAEESMRDSTDLEIG